MKNICIPIYGHYVDVGINQSKATLTLFNASSGDRFQIFHKTQTFYQPLLTVVCIYY